MCAAMPATNKLTMHLVKKEKRRKRKQNRGQITTSKREKIKIQKGKPVVTGQAMTDWAFFLRFYASC